MKQKRTDNIKSDLVFRLAIPEYCLLLESSAGTDALDLQVEAGGMAAGGALYELVPGVNDGFCQRIIGRVHLEKLTPVTVCYLGGNV